MTKTELQQQALANARAGHSVMNYAAIFQGFLAKGIQESEIKPRENVFTFHAWKALGRSVKRGEHGVRVVTFVDYAAQERDPSTGEEKTVSYRRPHTTTVFHISQTEPTSERLVRRSSSDWESLSFFPPFVPATTQGLRRIRQRAAPPCGRDGVEECPALAALSFRRREDRYGEGRGCVTDRKR
jgi:antirestriction protein ArdC